MFVSVSVVALITTVSAASWKVIALPPLEYNIEVTIGVVKVLFVRVSVVALPTRVSVAEGNVSVTSAVAAGPISLTLFVPLSLSS